MFRVYSGPSGTTRMSPLEKSRHLYKEFTALDDAINWAHHLKETGRSVMLIEGDDGTHLDHSAIAKTLFHRGAEASRRTS
jgi:hypothetical protein